MAGVIGAVVGSILAIPFQLMAGQMQQQVLERILAENPEITPEMRLWIERVTAASGLWIVTFLVSLVVYAVFGVLGGLLGVAVGIGGTRLVQALYPSFPMEPPAWAVPAAAAVSLSVGVIFGALPARRAAGLDPVAALSRR